MFELGTVLARDVLMRKFLTKIDLTSEELLMRKVLTRKDLTRTILKSPSKFRLNLNTLPYSCVGLSGPPKALFLSLGLDTLALPSFELF